MNIVRYIRYFIIFVLSLSIMLTFAVSEADAAKKKAKKAATKAKVAPKAKAATKATKKSKRRSPVRTKSRAEVLTQESEFLVSFSDTLEEGIVYKKLLVGNMTNKVAAHVIEVDLNVPGNMLSVIKAKRHITELDKLQEMQIAFDSVHNDRRMLAAINANFWRAGSNAPMGPVVCNGEVVQINSYKNWTSAMFDSRNRMYIDRFSMIGTITGKRGFYVTLDMMNRRVDTNQIVMYNQYAGESIPYISKQKLNEAVEQAMLGLEDKDITDYELDSADLAQQIQLERRMESLEYSMPKLTLRYLSPPAVNKNIYCVVQSIDSGEVSTTPKHCILSLGRKFPSYKTPRIGDTLMLKFETNRNSNVIFYNAVCGTPRIVRDGVARSETAEEGLSSRRFISGNLPRTAIGTSRDKRKAYLIVCEASSSTQNVRGADLADIATIMKMVGAHDAMNLDGGGSSILSIDGLNQIRPENPSGGRRISVGLGVVKKYRNKYHREAMQMK